MAKLKLGPLADDKPVKVTVELPASLHRATLARLRRRIKPGAGTADHRIL